MSKTQKPKKKKEPKIKFKDYDIKGRGAVPRIAKYCPFCGKEPTRLSAVGGGGWYICDCGQMNEQGEKETGILFRVFTYAGGCIEHIAYAAELTVEMPEDLREKMMRAESSPRTRTTGKKK